MRRLDRLERSRRTTPISSRTCCGGCVHTSTPDPALIPHPFSSSAPPFSTRAHDHPHPSFFFTLQIRGFLKNKQWETRVAAAKAVSFICEGIHHATVADIARLEGISLEDAAAGADKLAAVKAEPNANPGDDDSDADVNLKFDEFDIVGVLDTAAPLLADDWISYTDESSIRLVTTDPEVGPADIEEKDFVFGDIDKDGDTDLIVVRKVPWTQPGGRPHAEAMALAEAGEQARGATVYVTLEPCAHVSPRGPACSDLLQLAGVARVVVAMESASQIVVTHEHADHLGGIAKHPRADGLVDRIRLTPEQLENRSATATALPASRSTSNVRLKLKTEASMTT